MQVPVAPFPWQSLDRVPRDAARGLADLRRRAAASVSLDKVETALSTATGQAIEIVVLSTDLVAAEPASLGGVSVAFTDARGSLAISVEVDRDLAMALVSSVLGRRPKLADPNASIDPSVHGAVAAIVGFVARLAHGPMASLRPAGPGGLSFALGERRIRVEATVLLGGQAFAARVIGSAPWLASPPERAGTTLLRALGAAPLSLPLVGATSLATRDELAALSVGDVFLPGEGWTVKGRPLQGFVRIVPPSGEVAIVGALGDDGRIVIRGVDAEPNEPFAIEKAEGAMKTTSDDTKGEQNSDKVADASRDEDIASSVLEAPVMVRVEIGQVTMTAREWADIGPGDVVTLGRRLGEPAILRIAGIEIARGELVDVDGELGVRIRASDRGGHSG